MSDFRSPVSNSELHDVRSSLRSASRFLRMGAMPHMALQIPDAARAEIELKAREAISDGMGLVRKSIVESAKRWQ
jgi:hypothetical protein